MDPIKIDLSSGNQLNESFLRMFGSAIESILKAMFGGYSIPVTIKGDKTQINAFTRTISKEKDFLANARKYGLDNPATYRSKGELNRAIRNFESATGIDWPLK